MQSFQTTLNSVVSVAQDRLDESYGCPCVDCSDSCEAKKHLKSCVGCSRSSLVDTYHRMRLKQNHETLNKEKTQRINGI